jgi:hypothetical protein
MERVYAHLSKNGCRKSGFLADPNLTGTVFKLFAELQTAEAMSLTTDAWNRI